MHKNGGLRISFRVATSHIFRSDQNAFTRPLDESPYTSRCTFHWETSGSSRTPIRPPGFKAPRSRLAGHIDGCRCPIPCWAHRCPVQLARARRHVSDTPCGGRFRRAICALPRPQHRRSYHGFPAVFLLSVDQSDIGLVDQCRCLHRLSGPFVVKTSHRKFSKLVVHLWQQIISGNGFTGLDTR